MRRRLAFAAAAAGSIATAALLMVLGATPPQVSPFSMTAPLGCSGDCTFNTLDAGTIRANSITAGIIDAGTLYVAGTVCLDPPTCAVSISNIVNQMVFQAPINGGRFAGDLYCGNVCKMGSNFADYVAVTGGNSGVGTTWTATSSGSNSGFNFIPKGNDGLKVNSLKTLVVHGTGTAQQAIEAGLTTTDGAGSAPVTFGTVFGDAPFCVCSTANGSGDACGHGGTTTSAVTLLSTPGAKEINYICIGAR
jgi:hypothetical protein